MSTYRTTRKQCGPVWPFVAGILALFVLSVCFGFAFIRALEMSAYDVPVVEAAKVDPAKVLVEAVAAEAPQAYELPYSQEDLEALALIVYQEAGADYCSDETRMMVGTVVLNRVADSRFPDTIEEVATQYKQYGRLYWTGLEWPERASTEVEAHAVARAYECAEQLLLGERVLPADVVYQTEFTQGTEVVAHQDGIYFCR